MSSPATDHLDLLALRGWLVRARLRLSGGVYRFRESLFLLPTCLVVAGLVVAEVAARLDRAGVGASLPGVLHMDGNAATWLLSTVAGATITTAGVVFSLTVVSLQLASSQFSPRVMRSFVRDRLSQVVIGVLVATFVHCVLTLRHVSGDPTAPAPPLSLTVTVALALAAVVLIVAHLDHLARRLQVGEVSRAIAAEGSRVLRRLDAEARDLVRAPGAGDVPATGGLLVHARDDGWVTQSLSVEIMRVVPPGTTVRLETRTGAYVHAGEVLAVLHPAPRGSAERAVHAVAGSVGVAPSRTMQEDADFALRQLVDIGLRALSPAVNDPTTAVEVVLRVGGLLRQVLTSTLPPTAVAGPGGRVLLRPWDLTYEEYVAHGLDQLRQASGGQPQVVAALVRVVRMLVAHVETAGRPEHLPVLRKQLDLLRDGARAGEGIHPSDLDKLVEIAEARIDPAEHRPASAGSDGPREREEQGMDDVRGEVERYGWALQYVLEEDRPDDSYAYTAGLTLRGLPELVVRGVAPRAAWGVLNEVAARATAGHVPQVGETLRGGAAGAGFRVHAGDAGWDLPLVREVVGDEADVRVLVLERAPDEGR